MNARFVILGSIVGLIVAGSAVTAMYVVVKTGIDILAQFKPRVVPE